MRAIAPGVVIRVQRRGPGGLEMLVQHPGFVGIYSHLGMVAPPIADTSRSLRLRGRTGGGSRMDRGCALRELEDDRQR